MNFWSLFQAFLYTVLILKLLNRIAKANPYVTLSPLINYHHNILFPIFVIDALDVMQLAAIFHFFYHIFLRLINFFFNFFFSIFFFNFFFQFFFQAKLPSSASVTEISSHYLMPKRRKISLKNMPTYAKLFSNLFPCKICLAYVKLRK